MSLIVAIVVSVLGLSIGVGVGYYLRLIISLGKKGSMELEIKQTMLAAKEEAQAIVEEAKKKAEGKVAESTLETKKKEEEWKSTENRLIKKEAVLDTRQGDIDKEIEAIKLKVEEIKRIERRKIPPELRLLSHDEGDLAPKIHGAFKRFIT